VRRRRQLDRHDRGRRRLGRGEALCQRLQVRQGARLEGLPQGHAQLALAAAVVREAQQPDHRPAGHAGVEFGQ
jgi:hypothetical protein